jgi:hypothetical protein
VHFDIYLLRTSDLEKVERGGEGRKERRRGNTRRYTFSLTREGSWPARRKLQPRLGRSPEVWLVMEDLYDSVLLLRYTLPTVQG